MIKEIYVPEDFCYDSVDECLKDYPEQAVSVLVSWHDLKHIKDRIKELEALQAKEIVLIEKILANKSEDALFWTLAKTGIERVEIMANKENIERFSQK